MTFKKLSNTDASEFLLHLRLIFQLDYGRSMSTTQVIICYKRDVPVHMFKFARGKGSANFFLKIIGLGFVVRFVALVINVIRVNILRFSFLVLVQLTDFSQKSQIKNPYEKIYVRHSTTAL